MTSTSVPAQDPPVNHFDNGTVEQQSARAEGFASEAAAQLVRRAWLDLRKRYGTAVESPLEAAFLLWWRVLEQGCLAAGEERMVRPAPQYQVGKYRLDFALLPAKVAVELDGHEFHEKTARQVAARNKRDRYLEDTGWRIFHFNGYEFLRNPVPCVVEARSAANDAVRNGNTVRTEPLATAADRPSRG